MWKLVDKTQSAWLENCTQLGKHKACKVHGERDRLSEQTMRNDTSKNDSVQNNVLIKHFIYNSSTGRTKVLSRTLMLA